MAVSVLFPDGSRSNVPAQLIGRKGDEGMILDGFRQVPLNCDPLWRYVQEDGMWIAKSRHGPDVRHLSPREEPCWWESIPQMCEPALPDKSPDVSLRTAA